ncbi:hypothetical protein O181_102280 [Austropuccinia psidii MF-1]|uniref:Uncharacterized protein n=1 Tax=Austropuccinia psidii MF-1 TaxID=1389203 RepID=A0A9Q3PIL5_9BASI|nr:hypothetical protein [Austropuccinia psidii MF-1]
MAPPFLRDLGYLTNEPEILKGKIGEEEDNHLLDQMTSKGLTIRKLLPKVNQVQPKNWTDSSTSEILVNVEDEKLKSQQIFHTLGRERNMNQRKSGSNPIHREFLAYGRAHSGSGTLRHGRKNSILPTTVQKLQDLKSKGIFFQEFPVIPGSLQQRTWSSNRKQEFS